MGDDSPISPTPQREPAAKPRKMHFRAAAAARDARELAQAPISAALIDSIRISSVSRALYAENSGVVLTV
jgi:hypothetical protein